MKIWNKLRSLTAGPASSTLLLAVAATLVYGVVSARGSGEPGLVPAASRPVMTPFTMNDLGGRPWALADHRGKVVLVNFFTTWCPPCNAEMPGLVETAKAYRGKGVDAVAVSLDRDGPDVVQRFAGRYHIPFPVVLAGQDPAGVTSDISAIPVTVLVDRQGRVAKRYEGMVDEKALKADLDALVAEPN